MRNRMPKSRVRISSRYETPARIKAMSCSKLCKLLKIRTPISSSYKASGRSKAMCSTKLMCRMLRNRRSLGSSAASSVSLPEHVISMILSRLPVKNILKFRCVSKSWRSLISSKHFVKSHLEVSKHNPDFASSSIIVSSTADSASVATLTHFPLHSLPSIPCPHPSKFDHSFPILDPRGSGLLLLGCCNGLSCAIVEGIAGKEFLLWNPTIRKSIIISPKMELNGMGYAYAFGFGFDESNDEYKVLVCKVIPDISVHLYSLKSNSCKRIDKHPIKKSMLNPEGMFVNGKIHWLVNCNNDGDVNNSNFGMDIVCFDVENEMFGEIVQQPQRPFLDKRFFPTIGVLGGCLCVVAGDRHHRKDLWVLKEYGVKESWNKVTSFDYDGMYDSSEMPRPLCMTPNEELMYLSGKGFYIFDPKNTRYLLNINHGNYHQFNICVQSLVSPFCYGGEENQKRWCERLVVDEDDSIDDYERSGAFKAMWRFRLGEENQKQWYQNQSDIKRPPARSPSQQPLLTKRHRRRPTWMKDYIN